MAKRERKNFRSVVSKAINDDKFHDFHGDNYLCKNQWDYGKREIKASPGCNWRENQKWWIKPNDLNLHKGFEHKNLSDYEKTNPRYFRDNHINIYKYDNPIGNDLEKYNDQNYLATTAGYAKDKKSVIASIQRKRNKIV